LAGIVVLDLCLARIGRITMREIISLAARWIINYLEIPNYLYVKTLGVLGKERVYNSEEQYWRDILVLLHN